MPQDSGNLHYVFQASNPVEVNILLSDVVFDARIACHILIYGCQMPLVWKVLFLEHESFPQRVTINGIETLLAPLPNEQGFLIDTFQTCLNVLDNLWFRFDSGGRECTFSLQCTARCSASYMLHLTEKSSRGLRREALNHWLINEGCDMLNLPLLDHSIIASLNRVIPGSGIPSWHWILMKGLEVDDSWFAKCSSYPEFLCWLALKGESISFAKKMHLSLSRRLETETFVMQSSSRQYGVNLFGLGHDTCGISEDLNCCKNALISAGIPITVIRLPSDGCSSSLREQAFYQPDILAPYLFNIFCLPAERHARVLLELGSLVTEQRYNIGYWPWEFTQLPREWNPLLPLINEAWAISSYVRRSLNNQWTANGMLKVIDMPLPVDPINIPTEFERLIARRNYLIPQDAVVVIIIFDARSSYDRKNPWDAIQAFQQAACSTNHKLFLVIKTMYADVSPGDRKRLDKILKTSKNIILINSVLHRSEMLALIGACDIYLSLHRSEGYGRIIAESILLGLEVVCTAYSGNMDYCSSSDVHLVDYDIVPVMPGEYSYFCELSWAQPSPSDSINKLKLAIQSSINKRSLEHDPSSARQCPILSTQEAGTRYKDRLESLWEERNIIFRN